MLGLFRFYGSKGITLDRGFMQYLWDVDGRKYLDSNTGHGVAFLGHSNPAVIDAVSRQFKRLATPGLSFKSILEERVLEALSKIAPGGTDTVLFLNTGAEAVEAALKIAWAYTGKKRIVAFRNSFHGRTLGALSVTWNPRYRKGFPVLEDAAFAPYNSSEEAIWEYVDSRTAAVIVEPVQGEGGVIPGAPEFLDNLYKAAEETGALLIVDEIQSGFGRTGRVWSYMKSQAKPDILLAGKSIGGGYPVSLLFTREEIASSLSGGRHGSTFAGNLPAMAAVEASVNVFLEDNVPGKALRSGEELLGQLERRLGNSRAVRSIRGEGLMIGVELRYRPEPVLRCLQEEAGVLALKAGVTVVRFLPPYMITGEDIERIAGGVESCVSREYSK